MTRHAGYPRLSDEPCPACGEHFTIHNYQERARKRCDYCRAVGASLSRVKRPRGEHLCAGGCGKPVESRSTRAFCAECKVIHMQQSREAYNAKRRGKTAEERQAEKRDRKGQGARYLLLYDPSMYPLAKDAELGAHEFRCGLEQGVFEPGTKFFDRLTKREFVVP